MPPKSDRLSFNPWPLGIVAAFAVFIAGTIALIVLSVRNHGELVAPDYYERDLAYQRTLDRQRRTEPLSDEIAVAYASGTRQVRLSLPGSHADAGAKGRIRFYRPSDAVLDHEVPLELASNGTQDMSGGHLLPGKWRVRLEWQVGEDEFFADRILVVPPGTRP